MTVCAEHYSQTSEPQSDESVFYSCQPYSELPTTDPVNVSTTTDPVTVSTTTDPVTVSTATPPPSLRGGASLWSCWTYVCGLPVGIQWRSLKF